MITIVYGKPGSGKTAFLAADAAHWMNYSADSLELFHASYNKVKELCDQGYRFTPPDRPPVYTNFRVAVPCGVIEPFKSYDLDGFRTGFEREDDITYDMMSVYPGSRIYFSEAQRYYNSRLFTMLPDWISRYYEQHRHFGLNFMLDVQRAGLIDLNIREIAERFVLMREVVHKTDKLGNIVASTFRYNEFSDASEVDRFSRSGSGDSVSREKTYIGNIFESYDSTSYYRSFIPKRGDFSHVVHPDPDSIDYIERFEEFYPQQAPEGFYGRKKDKEKKTRKGKEVESL